MTTIKTYDGAEHQVTAAWAAECVTPFPELAKMSASQHEQLRQALLRQSNERALNDEEVLKLEALTKWQNVNRAWKWLAGRHYSEVSFTCLDQVHGNRHHHACGCVTQHIFDHNLASVGKPHEHHAHYPHRSCKKHVHLALDFKAHRDQVIVDNAKS